MLYCPNPFCSRTCRKSKKPFLTSKSFSNHIQQSAECKAYVFEETASVSAPSMLASSKRQSTITTTTTQLFKKQRLRLNPTFTQHQHANTTSTLIFEDQAMDDDCISVCDDYDNSIASEESMCSEEYFGNNVFADNTEISSC
jgi:hypothetical protein